MKWSCVEPEIYVLKLLWRMEVVVLVQGHAASVIQIQTAYPAVRATKGKLARLGEDDEVSR